MRAHNNMADAMVMRQPESGDELTVVAAEVLLHLAHPTRLALCRLICEAEQDVNTLSAQLSASRSSVSQHLGRLRLAGLVSTRRDGRRVLYSVTSDHLRELTEATYQFAEHRAHDISHHTRER